MWKLILIASLCVASGLAKPLDSEPEKAARKAPIKAPIKAVEERHPKKYVVAILKQENILEPDGNFHYSYEAEDGSKAGEVGEIKIIDKDTAAKSVTGFWEYKYGDKTYRSEYVADENGFSVHGDHIPAIPDYILRSLEYNKAHPQKDELLS